MVDAVEMKITAQWAIYTTAIITAELGLAADFFDYLQKYFHGNKYRIWFTKKTLSVSNYISLFILNIITSCIYIDNGWKLKQIAGVA